MMNPCGWAEGCFTMAIALGLAGCMEQGMAAPSGATFHVAAIGDSIASGQGAPDKDASKWPPWDWMPEWQDERCNRSIHAGTFQAVERIGNSPQPKTIEFRSFACSGASIAKGLLGPYDGVAPLWKRWLRPDRYREPLRPQVEEALKWAKELDEQRTPAEPYEPPIDVLTISIGANDILATQIVGACILPTECNIARPIIEHELLCLVGSYKKLREEIDKELAGYTKHIIVTGYPDPARDVEGEACNHAPRRSQGKREPLAGISAGDSEWISGVLRDLNETIRTETEDHGWTYLDVNADVEADGVVDEGFPKHGWCSDQNWSNTINDSIHKQRHFRGGVHPNISGHDVYARRLHPLIDEMLTE